MQMTFRWVGRDDAMPLPMIESIPAHDGIKLGRPSRDAFIDAYRTSIAQALHKHRTCSALAHLARQP